MIQPKLKNCQALKHLPTVGPKLGKSLCEQQEAVRSQLIHCHVSSLALSTTLRHGLTVTVWLQSACRLRSFIPSIVLGQPSGGTIRSWLALRAPMSFCVCVYKCNICCLLFMIDSCCPFLVAQQAGCMFVAILLPEDLHEAKRMTMLDILRSGHRPRAQNQQDLAMGWLCLCIPLWP